MTCWLFERTKSSDNLNRVLSFFFWGGGELVVGVEQFENGDHKVWTPKETTNVLTGGKEKI